MPPIAVVAMISAETKLLGDRLDKVENDTKETTEQVSLFRASAAAFNDWLKKNKAK